MTRLWLTMAFALALCACSAGTAGNSTNAPAQPRVQLASFDAQGLERAMELPDIGAYWRGAEQKNGNTHPFRAGISDCQMVVRIGAQGSHAIWREGKFVECSIAALTLAVEELARSYWNQGQKASYANVLLLADQRSAMRPILEMCEKLTNARVANLLLCVRDGEVLRLLPMHVDISQANLAYYTLPKDQWSRIAHLRLSDKPRKALLWQLDKSYRVEASGDAWGRTLLENAAFKKAAIDRLQFELGPELKLSDFAQAVNALAPRGVARLEFFVPALYRIVDAPVEPDTGPKWEEYRDELEISKRVKLSPMAHYWLDGRSAGVRAPAKLNSKEPILAVAVSEDGHYGTRKAKEAWKEQTEASLLDLLRELASESLEGESMASRAQVVIGVDGAARASCIAALLEMLAQARIAQRYLLTLDSVGSVIRLLDLNQAPREGNRARLSLLTEAAGKVRLEFQFGDKKAEIESANWVAELSKLALEFTTRPAVLAISAKDVSASVVFSALDALTPLGMKDVAFAP